MRLSMVLFRTRVHNADHNEQRRGSAGHCIQGACWRSQRWKQKSDPAVTLDVQTGLTTPPKSHYSPTVSCCQVQFVLLAKARRTTRSSCWLWQMSSGHVWTKKKRNHPHDDARYWEDFRGHKSSYIKVNAIHAHLTTRNNCLCMSYWMFWINIALIYRRESLNRGWKFIICFEHSSLINISTTNFMMDREKERFNRLNFARLNLFHCDIKYFPLRYRATCIFLPDKSKSLFAQFPL